MSSVANLACFAGRRGKRPTASTLTDLNRGPATDEIGTETARRIANGRRTVTVTAAVPPTETASETGTAIRTETGTTTARGIETVITGPNAVTAVNGTTTATATIDGTVAVTVSEIANGTGTTGGRSGLARILTRVDQMRKDVKRTQWKMGLPADASLSLDLRRRNTQGTLRGVRGTTMTPRTTAAEKRDRLGSLPQGETCPLTNSLGLPSNDLLTDAPLLRMPHLQIANNPRNWMATLSSARYSFHNSPHGLLHATLVISLKKSWALTLSSTLVLSRIVFLGALKGSYPLYIIKYSSLIIICRIGYVELRSLDLVPKAIALTGTIVMGLPVKVQLTEAERNRVHVGE